MNKTADVKLAIVFKDKNSNIVCPDKVPFDLIVKNKYARVLLEASFNGSVFDNCLVRDNRLIFSIYRSDWDKGIDATILLHYVDAEILDDNIYTHKIDIAFRDVVNCEFMDAEGTIICEAIGDVIYEVVGRTGISAYEEVVARGLFFGTFEEWIGSLKQPALDAQADAYALMAEFQTAENLRDKAELDRIATINGLTDTFDTKVDKNELNDKLGDIETILESI